MCRSQLHVATTQVTVAPVNAPSRKVFAFVIHRRLHGYWLYRPRQYGVDSYLCETLHFRHAKTKLSVSRGSVTPQQI